MQRFYIHPPKDERNAELIADHEGREGVPGLTVRQLANKYRLSRHRVQVILRRHEEWKLREIARNGHLPNESFSSSIMRER